MFWGMFCSLSAAILDLFVDAFCLDVNIWRKMLYLCSLTRLFCYLSNSPQPAQCSSTCTPRKPCLPLSITSADLLPCGRPSPSPPLSGFSLWPLARPALPVTRPSPTRLSVTCTTSGRVRQPRTRSTASRGTFWGSPGVALTRPVLKFSNWILSIFLRALIAKK